MKQFIFFTLSFLGLFSIANAQKEVDINWNPSKKDIAYYEARAYIASPQFGLQKVKEIIQKEAKEPSGDEAPFEFNRSISKKSFNNLTVEERFTYTMIHPEIYSQACAEQLYMKKPEQKIFAQLLSVYSGEEWSERQISFLKENKSSVISLLEQSILKDKKMGLNYKTAYLKMDAWEAIPFIISYYKKNKKDKDALTLLMLLMKKGNYTAFTQSKISTQLYGSDISYDEWVVFNATNEKIILQTAESYFKSK